jgi:hypothetical protein
MAQEPLFSHLPSKWEALSSNSIVPLKKKGYVQMYQGGGSEENRLGD